MYSQTPRRIPNIGLEERSDLLCVDTKIAGRFFPTSDGLHDMANKKSVNVPIIPHHRNNFFLAEKLNHQIIYGVRIPLIENTPQMRTSGLGSKDQNRVFCYPLRRESGNIDVDLRGIRNEV